MSLPTIEGELRDAVRVPRVGSRSSPSSPSNDQEIILGVASHHDADSARYESASRVVQRMYEREVGVPLDPKYISPSLIAAFLGNTAVGAVGLTTGQEDILLTELMCREEVDRVLKREGVVSRQHFGEFGCLSMHPLYRKTLLPILIKTALEYALSQEVRYTIITIGMHVRRHLAGLPLELLSDRPEPPPEVAALWAIKYATTNPASFGLPVPEAIHALQSVVMPENATLDAPLARLLHPGH